MPAQSFNQEAEIGYHLNDPATPPSLEEQAFLEQDMRLWVPDFPQVFAGKDILDLGGGRGTASMLISRKFAPRSITHFDLSHKRLTAAREWQRSQSNYFIVCGSVYELPFPDQTFDLIISNSFLHHLPNVQMALSEAGRVLRPGGLYVGREPNFNNPLVRLGVFSPLSRLIMGASNHSQNEYPLRAQEIEAGFIQAGCQPDLQYFWRRIPGLRHPLLSVAISVRGYRTHS
ncbi:MAG: class I SAM-dependent methyltransferase [Anaerolineae bacterium]|nr:class I SAM-dependent methyltransferase [Anaerolineae bacterium]